MPAVAAGLVVSGKHLRLPVTVSGTETIHYAFTSTNKSEVSFSKHVYLISE